jgi:iron complex outermembrane receptor protein
MSLEELVNVTVSSVSKKPEPLSTAPAAIYVITADDIHRSGATLTAEALRLAPNLFIAQTSPADYTVAPRGLSGNAAAQNFANKLLVLIDGRSVYSPLYSGVYWDMQNVMLDDMERVEVISGPGATLWGANAVNGVINFTSKNSADTQGGLLSIEGGNLGGGGSLRYGGRLNDNLTYRVYAKGFAQPSLKTSAGVDEQNQWSEPRGGFRLDWARDRDLITVQGDIAKADEGQLNAPDQYAMGDNLLARWQHQLSGDSSIQVQAYYDYVHRWAENGGSFTLRTYDLQLQHSFDLGSWNKIVWGAGERISPYHIVDRIDVVSSLVWSPNRRTLHLTNAFVQDHVDITRQLSVILGVKVEDDPYSGVSAMPSARVSWQPRSDMLLWAAASRAIRSPTPFDVDVVEKLGPTPFLTGNPDFQPEELSAYEVGYRGQFSADTSLNISGYLHHYDRLRSIEFSPAVFPLQWGNTMEGRIYGVEMWGNYQATAWWRLSAGLRLQGQRLRFKPGASGLLGIAQAGDDPGHMGYVRSSMNIGDRVTVDADFRYVGHLADPAVPAYVELNGRIGWAVSQKLEIALAGMNLLHRRHVEFIGNGGGYEIPRSFSIQTQWRF